MLVIYEWGYLLVICVFVHQLTWFYINCYELCPLWSAKHEQIEFF